jgi:hypothetical protein
MIQHFSERVHFSEHYIPILFFLLAWHTPQGGTEATKSNSTQIYWRKYGTRRIVWEIGWTCGTSSPDQLVETPALAKKSNMIISPISDSCAISSDVSLSMQAAC